MVLAVELNAIEDNGSRFVVRRGADHAEPLGTSEGSDTSSQRHDPDRVLAIGIGTRLRLRSWYHIGNHVEPVRIRSQIAENRKEFIGAGDRLSREGLFHSPIIFGPLPRCTLCSVDDLSNLVSVTLRVDIDLPVLQVGARSGLLWIRDRTQFAGIGRAAEVAFERPHGFKEAMDALKTIRSVDEVQLPGTGPMAFAALDFDPTADGELIIPEILLGVGANGERWITVTGDAETSPFASAFASASDRGSGGGEALADGPESEEVVNQVSAAIKGTIADYGNDRALSPTAFNLSSVLPPETWRDDIVGVARQRIADGELDKAVLARELVLNSDQPVDQAVVVERLAEAFPTAALFSVDNFIGASPELLVSRHRDVVRAHPLAGTAPRGSDPRSDQALAAGLLASSKDRWEHQITINWLLDTLLPFCSYVDAEPEPTIVSLANVHHLGTRVEGRLSSPSAPVLELVAALHPTPAVGGDPQKEALELISEIELTDRRRYAGPTGWFDSDGNGEFAVAVRSAEFESDTVRLYAGVGVVADSDPQAELDETRSKFRAILGALLRP